VDEIMNFDTFCKETGKIIVLPEHAEIKIHDSAYMTSAESEILPLKGFYFPNRKELNQFYDDLGGDLFYSRNRKYLPFMQIYFCNSFMEKFRKYLNIDLEEVQFEEIKKFLIKEKEDFRRKAEERNRKKEPENNYEPINLDKLTELIGQAYEKIGLLEQDIRFDAMKLDSEAGIHIKVIGHLKKQERGYSGLGFAFREIKQ
jgi:hypothetical protein